MLSSVKWLSAAAVAVLALAPSARAQVGALPNSPLFQVNPYLAAYRQNLAVGRAAPQILPGAGAAIPPLANPYLGAATLGSTPFIGADPYTAGLASPFFNPYLTFADPFGGYFRGVADLTSAYGRYAIDMNQARLINQQVLQAKIETRRKLFDEWRYERENMPTAEDMRKQNRERDLAYARQSPPLTAVLDGSALNTLLGHLKERHSRDQRGPDVRLDEEAMRRVNVRPPAGGNIGLLRNGANLNWPESLRGGRFDEIRRQFEQNAVEAVNRARANGRVDAALMKNLQTDFQALNDELRRSVDVLSPTQYIDARRYLNLVEDALLALRDPNVQNYFNRTYEARGRTVSDLVEYMNQKGLEFAPAVPGDEAIYRALFNSLAAYDDAISRVAVNK